MTEQEMIDKLRLTADQKRAFNRLKKALKDFEDAGGILVGNNEFQYAMNGQYFICSHDSYENDKLENYIELDGAGLDYVIIRDSYSDSAPYIEVGE